MKKQLLVTLLVTAMAVTSLTGCGELKADDVVATVGDTEIKGNVANFYSRYVEASYESMSASALGGADKMWSTKLKDNETYEDSAKKTIMDNLKQFYALKNHMADYKVEITDEEKAEIDKAAKKFEDSNELEPKKAINGDAKTVAEVMTLFKIQQKMREAMTTDVDTNVSDEEAAQKGMQYAFFSYSKTDDSGNSTALSDKEKKNLKKQADKFTKEVRKKPKTFETVAKKSGIVLQDVTFDSESEAPAKELVAAADKLKKGEITGLITTDNGFYIARVTSMLDRSATDAKKKQIVADRKTEAFDKAAKKLVKKDGSSIHKRNWKKIDFTKLGVTAKQSEENPYDSVNVGDVEGTTTAAPEATAQPTEQAK